MFFSQIDGRRENWNPKFVVRYTDVGTLIDTHTICASATLRYDNGNSMHALFLSVAHC
jgi:hypothetical protein